MKWIKPLIILIIGLLVLITIFSSCAPHRAVISPHGKVIERDGDSYLILWRDLADKPYSYAYNWVYLPGISNVSLDDLEVVIQVGRKEGSNE